MDIHSRNGVSAHAFFVLKGCESLKKENPFSHKYVEKMLFKTCKVGPLSSRRARTFLRRQARYIEHAYEIGHKDALSRKALIPQEALPDLSDSPMGRRTGRWTYTAYLAGYRDGSADSEVKQG